MHSRSATGCLQFNEKSLFCYCALKLYVLHIRQLQNQPLSVECLCSLKPKRPSDNKQKHSPEEDFKLLCVRINVLKVQSHHCFNRVIRPGSRCRPRPTLNPALLGGCCSCPSSACPSSCDGSWEETARWEQQKPPIWR